MATPVKSKVPPTKSETVLATLATLTPESVTKKVVTSLGDVQKFIANIAAVVNDRFAEVQTLDTAISLKRQDLENLRQIEVTATKLDELREQIQTATDQRQEDELEALRARERQEDEYNYALSQRRRAEDTLRNETIQQAQKGLELRAAELEANEAESEELREKAKLFPEQLENAKKAARAEGIGIAGRDAAVAERIASAQHAAEILVLKNQANHLQQALTMAENRTAELQVQLKQAHQDNKELASKSVESAHHKQLAESLQRSMEAQAASNQPRR